MRGQVVIKAELFWWRRKIWKQSVNTSRLLLWFENDFLAKFRSGFGVEFGRRLTVLWSQPHTDLGPIKSIHKLTGIADRTAKSQPEWEPSWHAVCSSRALSSIALYQTALSRENVKAVQHLTLWKNKHNRPLRLPCTRLSCVEKVWKPSNIRRCGKTNITTL